MRTNKRVEKIIKTIEEGKHYTVVRKHLKYIKRKLPLIKELALNYGFEEKEKFVQVSVPKGKYIIHAIYVQKQHYPPVKTVKHYFAVKEAREKHVKGHTYHVLSMRIPAAMRNSKIYIKIYGLKLI